MVRDRLGNIHGLLRKSFGRQQAGPLRLTRPILRAQLRGVVPQHVDGHRQHLQQRGLDDREKAALMEAWSKGAISS